MNPTDIPKTVLITPYGLFEFVCTSFRLQNASRTFQQLINGIFRGSDLALDYEEYIVFASSSIEENISCLTWLFEKLSKFGIIVSQNKCVLGASEIEFLGELVNTRGTSQIKEKAQSIIIFSAP